MKVQAEHLYYCKSNQLTYHAIQWPSYLALHCVDNGFLLSDEVWPDKILDPDEFECTGLFTQATGTFEMEPGVLRPDYDAIAAKRERLLLEQGLKILDNLSEKSKFALSLAGQWERVVHPAFLIPPGVYSSPSSESTSQPSET